MIIFMVQQDSTKAVFKMSVPIFIELLLQLLVGNIDQIMISRYSQSSVAAIGNGNQIMNIVIIVLNVTTIASTILISQYLGAQNKRKITETCNVSLLLITLTGVAAAMLLCFGHNAIFTWLKIPNDILEEAGNYLSIVGSFAVVQGIYIAFAAILRSFGFMKQVMYVSVVMNLINIAGNAVLINGLFGLPQLGIVGAAISTNISKIIGLIIIFRLFRKNIDIKISPKILKPFPTQTLKDLLHIAIPSGGEELSYNLSQVCILKFINIFGTAVIATKVYCSMLANVAYVYSIALSQATQIMVGYLIGAGDLEKVKNRIWKTLLYSMVIALSVTAILYFNAETIFHIFTDDTQIISLGKKILFIEFFLEMGRTVNILMTKCLTAVGDVIFPVVIGIIFMWFFAVLGGYYFGVHLGMGLVGIWIAMTIDECTRGILFVIRFRSEKWRNKTLQVSERLSLAKPVENI